MTDFVVDGVQVKTGRIVAGGPTVLVGDTTTMTRGSDGSDTGYTLVGLTAGPIGSLADDTFYLGNQCRIVATFSGNLFVEFTGNVGQPFFTSIVCSLGTFDTASVTAYAVFGGTNSRWRWDLAGTFPSSGNEVITIVA